MEEREGVTVLIDDSLFQPPSQAESGLNRTSLVLCLDLVRPPPYFYLR